MNAERAHDEEVMAQMYAEEIEARPDDYVFWHKFNKVIIDRWSVSALKRIKRRAWQIVNEAKR